MTTTAEPDDRTSGSAPSRLRALAWAPFPLRIAYGLGVTLAMAALLLLTGLLGSAGPADHPTTRAADVGRATTGPTTWQRQVVAADALASQIGAQIVYVAVTGGGGLIDLRITVVDPTLANSLHDINYPPGVVDASSGLVANSLLMGHSHGDPFRAGETYYYILENPGNVIQRGGQVSVLLGAAEVDGVDVR